MIAFAAILLFILLVETGMSLSQITFELYCRDMSKENSKINISVPEINN